MNKRPRIHENSTRRDLSQIEIVELDSQREAVQNAKVLTARQEAERKEKEKKKKEATAQKRKKTAAEEEDQAVERSHQIVVEARRKDMEKAR